MEWNKLSLEVQNSVSHSIFKKSLLKFIITIRNSAFKFADIYGIKLLTRLCVDSSQTENSNLNMIFRILLIRCCSLEIESTFHFFSALPKFHHPKNQSHEKTP